MLSKIKNTVREIHWPSRKELIGDTIFTIVTTIILSLTVSMWTTGIEYIVDWVISLF